VKLKTALSLLIGTGLVLALLGLFHVEMTNQQRQTWRGTTQITHDLARSVSDLEGLAYEWILRPSSRPVQQWALLKRHIENQIDAISSQDSGMESPKALTIALERANRLFQILVKDSDDNIPLEKRSGIIDQLLVHTRELSLQADLLLSSSLNMQDHSAQRDLFILYIGVILIGLACFMLVFVLHRRIIIPLKDIERTTRSLGESLDFPTIRKRHNDELGMLVDSFNEMLARMRRMTHHVEEQSAKRAEEQLLHNLTDSQPQPVWIADIDGLISWKNKAFKQIFGTGYVGSPWAGLVHPDDILLFDEHFTRDSVDDDLGNIVECRLATQNGWRWFVVRTAILATTTTIPHPWICTAGDIHERRIMEEHLRESRRRSEALNRVSVELTGELNPLVLAHAICGTACDLLQGECAVFHLAITGRDGSLKPQTVHVPAELPSTFHHLTTLEEESWPLHAINVGKPSEPAWNIPKDLSRIGSLIIVPVTISTSERDCCLFVAHRSPDRFNEDDLRLLVSLGNIASAAIENARLHAFERAAIRLADSRSRLLERSNNDLQEFAYVASHDLQEPLRMISSYLDVIRERCANQFDADSLRYLDRATTAATRMTRLVKDLLTYSRAGHDTDHNEPVDLSALAEEIGDDLRARLDECGGSIIITEPLPTIRGRSLLIRQVLMNVMQNALKYRHPDRSPVITISTTSDPTEIRVHVTDNGIGVPEQYRERIFRLFQRLNRGPAEGSGIGLSICRKLVRAWGGEIIVSSDGENGSTFTFTIPTSSGSGGTPSAAFPALK
jgi:PAS domain S-box-containing protein